MKKSAFGCLAFIILCLYPIVSTANEFSNQLAEESQQKISEIQQAIKDRDSTAITQTCPDCAKNFD